MSDNQVPTHLGHSDEPGRHPGIAGRMNWNTGLKGRRGGSRPCQSDCRCGRHSGRSKDGVHGDDKLAFIDLAKSRPCHDCGNSFPIMVMDLDHTRGKKKSGEWMKFTWQELVEEVAKCDTVCANCHRLRTATRAGWTRALSQMSPAERLQSTTWKTRIEAVRV